MVTIRRKEGTIGFLRTFDQFWVTDEWAQELYNYFIEGLPPGSFHRACFENNLVMAAIRSHPSNEWTAIMQFMKWLFHNAPARSWHDPDSVTDWLELTAEERFAILHDRGWVMTPEEITFNKVAGKPV